MSKSLKNFVTVRELLGDSAILGSLQGCDPADVFRLYCMQHPYRSVLSFSGEGMASAAGVLARWSNLFRECRALPNPPRVPWGDDEAKLWAQARGLRGAVGGALLDDLDAPAAVREISGLVEGAFRYLRGRGDVNPFVLWEVGKSSQEVCEALGFRSVRVDWKPVTGPGWSQASQDQAAATASLLREFRDRVRKVAIQSVGAKTAGGQDLLALCDALRDQVGPSRAPWVDFRDSALKDIDLSQWNGVPLDQRR